MGSPSLPARKTRTAPRRRTTAAAPGSRRVLDRCARNAPRSDPEAGPAGCPAPRPAPAHLPDRCTRHPATPCVSSAAARARRVPRTTSEGASCRLSPMSNPVSSRPYRVTCRIVSWFDSTHVGGAPTCGMGGERVVDDRADRPAIPRAAQELEVEGRVQLVGPKVARVLLGRRKPDLADHHALAVVGIGDPAPRTVDVVHLGPVLVGQVVRDRDRVRRPEAPASSSGRARHRCGTRRHRGRARSAGSPRTPRASRGPPSSGRAAPG